jgi:integrase
MLSEMATLPTEPRLEKHHGHLVWVTWWRDDSKKLRAKRFGKSTELSAKAARARFQFWYDTEWKAKDHVRNPDGSAATYTVTRLAAQYLRWARKYFTKNGKPTKHVEAIVYSMRELRDRFGDRPAETMESPDLAATRDGMIHGARTRHRKNPETGVVEEVVEEYTRSLKTVNDRLLIMKQAFEWAREKGRIPRPVVLDLNTVNPLQRGRTEAKNPRDVPPIAAAIVDATLPACTPTVRAMIKVNMYSGARPGEVCVMRGCDLAMVTDDCWIFTPHTHKMEHKGIVRKIALGPPRHRRHPPLPRPRPPRIPLLPRHRRGGVPRGEA